MKASHSRHLAGPRSRRSRWVWAALDSVHFLNGVPGPFSSPSPRSAGRQGQECLVHPHPTPTCFQPHQGLAPPSHLKIRCLWTRPSPAASCQSLESEGYRGWGSQRSWGGSKAKETFLVFGLPKPPTDALGERVRGQEGVGQTGQELGVEEPGGWFRSWIKRMGQRLRK